MSWSPSKTASGSASGARTGASTGASTGTPSKRCSARWRSLAMVVAVTTIGAGCDDAPRGGIVFDPPRAMPSFTFARHDGSRVETSASSADASVVFFGYTHCPDICPTTLADWARVKARLGTRSARVRFMFVTVDPARDTPAVAQEYAARFDPSFLGLSGEPSMVAAMESAFGASSVHDDANDEASKDDDSTRSTSGHAGAHAGYAVNHSTETYLLDGRGRLLAVYRRGTAWDVLAADLERVL